MLLRCCLIHITIIILTHFILLYLCPCLGLGLLMSYICDLFFLFSLVFIVINHITSLKQMYLTFLQFFKNLLLSLDDNIDEESKYLKSRNCRAQRMPRSFNVAQNFARLARHLVFHHCATLNKPNFFFKRIFFYIIS